MTEFFGNVLYNKMDALLEIDGKFYYDTYKFDTDCMTDMTGKKYAYHHTSKRKNFDFGGYVPVAIIARYLTYTGRFGHGFARITNFSTAYVWVDYYIEYETE